MKKVIDGNVMKDYQVIYFFMIIVFVIDIFFFFYFDEEEFLSFFQVGLDLLVQKY